MSENSICRAVSILVLGLFPAACAPSGGYVTVFEVGVEFAERLSDSDYPHKRAHFLTADVGGNSPFDEISSQWGDGCLATNALRRFRAEYPESGFSDERVLRTLKGARVERVQSTKIVTVEIRSDSRQLSEQLAGTMARTLADSISGMSLAKVTAKLERAKGILKSKEEALEAWQKKIDAFGKEEVRKLVQSPEYVRLMREQDGKIYPEYLKAHEEVEHVRHTSRKERILSCVLGRAPTASARGTDGTTNQVAHLERPNQSVNGGWYEDPCSHHASVNTNAALYGFLGCRFGKELAYVEEYVRLKESFDIFPWVRYEACSRCRKIGRCDARLTFRTQGLSKVPFRKMRRMQSDFANRYGLRFTEERRGEDYFAEAQDVDGYRVGLFVTNALVWHQEVPFVEYTLGFEVVNKQVLSQKTRHAEEWSVYNWENILHRTDIPGAQRNSESQWCYRVVKGKSTEELLDEYIKTGNKKDLQVGRGTIGTPVGWGGGGSATGYFAQNGVTGNSGYCCTEWEADTVLPSGGYFVKVCDGKTMNRISTKLYRPGVFRPREKGKTRSFTVGRIYCELMPGDQVMWDREDCRKTGTICAEGEVGEYWDCIKKTVKNVTTIERARKEDWTLSARAREYDKKRGEISSMVYRLRSRIHRRGYDSSDEHALIPFDFASTNLIAVTNLLADGLAKRRPGRYWAPSMNSGIDMLYPSRENVRKKVRRQENRLLNYYQYELYHARRELLDACFPTDLLTNGVSREEARIFALSRFELERIRLGSKWWNALSYPRYDHHAVLVLKHHVFDEQPPVFSDEELAKARSTLMVYEDRLIDFVWRGDGEPGTEAELVVCAMYEMLYSAFASANGFNSVNELLPLCCRTLAANIHSQPVQWLLKRIVVEFKDNPGTWKFAQEVLDELDRIEQKSFVKGRTAAGQNMMKWLSKSRTCLMHP